MTTTKTPIWFWIVSILLLLWNATGILNFLGQLMMTEEMLQALPLEQQKLHTHFSWWVKATFGIAVTTGTIGSIALLARKSIAKKMFLISLLGIFIQTSNNLYHSWETALFGTIINWFVVLVLTTVLAVKVCDYGLKKGWIK